MVVGLNLGRSKLNFFFAKISFGVNGKGQGNPSSQKGLEKQLLMNLEWQLNSKFNVIFFLEFMVLNQMN